MLMLSMNNWHWSDNYVPIAKEWISRVRITAVIEDIHRLFPFSVIGIYHGNGGAINTVDGNNTFYRLKIRHDG